MNTNEQLLDIANELYTDLRPDFDRARGRVWLSQKKNLALGYLSKKQGTVAREMKFVGRGLHLGATVTMTIRPAQANTGFVFVRNGHEIKAVLSNVLETIKANKISDGLNGYILTPEHILSALGSIGINNAYIELDGNEVPIFDGSSAAFRDKLLASGIVKELKENRRTFSIKKPIIFSREEEGLKVLVLPTDKKELRLSYFINFSNPAIGSQYETIVLNTKNYWREIANSRTFIEKENLEELAKVKRYLGIDNGNGAVLLDEHGKSVGKGFSVKNEAVRHKILDLFGDLQLAGVSIYGHVIAIEGGHRDHNEIVRKIVRIYHLQEYETYSHKQLSETIQKFELLMTEGKVPEDLYYEVLRYLGNQRGSHTVSA